MPRPPSNVKRKAEVNAGRIVGPFGRGGELKVDASRIGADAFHAGLAVTLRFADGTMRKTTVTSVRVHKGRPLVRIDGVADLSAAEQLGTADMLVAREDAPLGASEYLDADLLGCRLVDEAGIERGLVVGVAHYPAQDMLIVGPERLLLPLVHAFVARVDVARKEIQITVPRGLLDPSQADEA